MSDSMNIVFLAAGKGTRLKLDIPKPLCRALGECIVDYVIKELEFFSQREVLDSHFNFVVGHGKEKVQEHIEETFSGLKKAFTWQKEQLGTGHALQCFFNENPKAYERDYTLVVCADTPAIKNEVYSELLRFIKSDNCDAVAASFNLNNPFGYGRIERSTLGFNIIEEKDASFDQKMITEVNSGLYIFKTSHIKSHIDSLTSENKSNEFYLTDLFKSDLNVKPISFSDENQFLGVNDLSQLEKVENILLSRKLENLQKSGVRILRSNSIYMESSVEVASGVEIHPNCSFYGDVKIASECIIEDGCVVKNSKLAKGVTLKAHSYLEGCEVGADSQIGPMARLREGSLIGQECKIGNFVETKKVDLDRGVKVSHLSYLGDAKVGENTNIGCGFITCNYDGAQKHQTVIGKDSFIGSDCQMIAPVSIGDEVFIGSGSTINQNVPSKGFAIARQRQTTKENMSHKFIKKK